MAAAVAQVAVPIAVAVAPTILEMMSKRLNLAPRSRPPQRKSSTPQRYHPPQNYTAPQQQYPPPNVPQQQYPPLNYNAPQQPYPPLPNYNAAAQPYPPFYSASQQYARARGEPCLDESVVDVDTVLELFRDFMCESALVRGFAPAHQALVSTPYSLLASDTFYHFMYAVYMKCVEIRDGRAHACSLCLLANAPDVARAKAIAKCREFFYNNASTVKTCLIAVYQCPAFLANTLWRILKPPINPCEGLFAWDVCMVVRDRVKKLNEILPPQHRTFFHGVIYAKDTTTRMYDYHATTIYAMHKEWPRHCLLAAIGTVPKPKHWCLVYIDLPSRTYIWFNSLAQAKDLEQNLHQRLCAIGGDLKFITNEQRLQGASKLCGFYVYYMLDQLMRCKSENLGDFFSTFTKEPNNWDQAMAEEVKSYMSEPANPFANMLDHIPEAPL